MVSVIPRLSHRVATPPMHQVETYKGTTAGWRPVGRPRSHSQASELRHKVQQIRPDFITRVRCVSPELFPI
jgi:hypothetical protein